MNSRFIFQAVNAETHLDAVQECFSIPGIERTIISTAFMNLSGVELLADYLEPLAENTTVIVGIRNGVTSAQAFGRLLDIGCTLYAVDTGSRGVIFHPKYYLASSAEKASLVLGSANFTMGGLTSNIEVSIAMSLDLSAEQDISIVNELVDKTESMIAEYPEHIFRVVSHDVISELLQAGRLIDETLVFAPSTKNTSRNRSLDSLSRMPLKTRPRGRVSPSSKVIAGFSLDISDRNTQLPQIDQRTLIWESKPLTRRDLTIPNAPNTNPTGSMLFKKGALENIDQRRYFRDVVFSNLNWLPKSKQSYKEVVETNFQIYIKGVDYGVHTLLLTHDTRTNTRSYEQRNSMTQVHWGTARPLVAKEDLLDRILTLYRDNTNENFFVMEID